MHSRQQLAADLQRLGIAPGDTVMVHASVRAVGEVAGGPDQIHLAIKDALTPSGTLVMYAGVPRYVDEVGRGNLTPAQEREVLEKLPAFDPRTARSDRTNGTLVEFLRSWPDTRVNEHAVRFAVWGAQTDYLFSEQPWDFAFGERSLLERLPLVGGKILLLGCDHDTVTFLHHAEHIGNFADKRVVRFQVPVLENGARAWKEMLEVDSSRGAHANWPDRFFARLTGSFLTRTGNAGGRVGDARSLLLSSRELLAFALPLMQAIAADARAADQLRELPPDA